MIVCIASTSSTKTLFFFLPVPLPEVALEVWLAGMMLLREGSWSCLSVYVGLFRFKTLPGLWTPGLVFCCLGAGRVILDLEADEEGVLDLRASGLALAEAFSEGRGFRGPLLFGLVGAMLVNVLERCPYERSEVNAIVIQVELSDSRKFPRTGNSFRRWSNARQLVLDAAGLINVEREPISTANLGLEHQQHVSVEQTLG